MNYDLIDKLYFRKAKKIESDLINIQTLDSFVGPKEC